MTDLNITLQGEQITLLLERALFQNRTEALFIADLHLGKAETFRSHAIPLPAGISQDDLKRLDAALERTQAKKLVILGDMLHASRGRDAKLFELFYQWRLERSALEIVLVRGNHDKGAGDPPHEWAISSVDAPFVEAPFVWSHHPYEAERGYVLAGHLHPAINLAGKGKQLLKLPCFWFGEKVGVLPAFTGFTASSVINPLPSDQVYVIAGKSVMPVFSGDTALPGQAD